MTLDLTNKKIRDLKNRIKDSFRVRPNHSPVYVEVGNYLERVMSNQNQVIFGRRGSGKSSLVVKALGDMRQIKSTLAIYVNADNVKRLEYPDLLVRLLLELMENLRDQIPFYKKFPFISKKTKNLTVRIHELRRLLDSADAAQVTEEKKTSKREESVAALNNDSLGSSAKASSASEVISGRIASFEEKKLNLLERHLRDYVIALEQGLEISGKKSLIVFFDDFYLIPKQWQPYIADYIHRLFRNSNFYFKIATIRHRTSLYKANGEHTIGLELSQDVEEINLDKTLEDVETTKQFLGSMLDQIAKDVDIEDICSQIFNPDSLESLTLASGGVPRDFLTIFVDAIDDAVEARSYKWLTPSNIWRAASRQAYITKLKNLRDDSGSDLSKLELVYNDVVSFCLKEKKKTAFLISRVEIQASPHMHELIQQLMDFKLIHIVEPDTSAASGRPGRFEAYTLDFATFMEPRLRNIEHVEFWKFDGDRRRIGLREAPDYVLSRAEGVYSLNVGTSIETEIKKIRDEN